MLPDKEYTMRVDFNAFAEIEEATGRNMMESKAFEKLTASTARKILWICIRQMHPEVTEREIGAQISLQNLPYVMQTLVKAWIKSMPKKDAIKEAAIPLQ